MRLALLLVVASGCASGRVALVEQRTAALERRADETFTSSATNCLRLEEIQRDLWGEVRHPCARRDSNRTVSPVSAVGK